MALELDAGPRSQQRTDCGRLARAYGLDLHEVRYIVQSFADVQAVRGDELRFEDIRRICERVFDTGIDPATARDAFKATCEGDSGRTAVERFCEWWRAHAFTVGIKKNDDDELARRHDVSPLVIDKVRKQFDRYDTDGSGEIEYDEFLGMLMQLLGVKDKGDLSKDRIQRFWTEIDEDGSGSVDFEEFFAWYMLYFDPSLEDESSSGPVGAFYKSFNPIVSRASMAMLDRQGSFNR